MSASVSGGGPVLIVITLLHALLCCAILFFSGIFCKQEASKSANFGFAD